MEMIYTPCGPIRGVPGRVPGTMAYKGIRYATAGRWELPREVKRWDGVYDASRYGNCSYQPRAFYNEEENLKKIFYYYEFRKGESYTYSEDCLFLNVFTPETAKAGDRYPVLLYIHGGGFTGGCGHEKHFDGPVWPAKGIIGVTINYRLGPMGFVTLPELEREQGGFAGNYGLHDQLTAIQWVRRNIAAFGGDPDNITIMGQSAGAMSVQQHLLSPLSRGTFRRAVLSSGGGVSKLMPNTKKETAQAFWAACMKNAGCESLQAFRALAPEKLFEVWQKTRKDTKGGNCFPVADGRFIIGDSKLGRDIPCMAGSTSEDMMPPILQSMAKSWCEGQSERSFAWYFDRRLPGDENGAWHSSDLWYWFGTLPNCWRPMTHKDYALSDQMTDYLTNFCKTGDPNGPAPVPTWAVASKNEKRVMTLGEGEVRMEKPPLLKMVKTMLTNKAVGE